MYSRQPEAAPTAGRMPGGHPGIEARHRALAATFRAAGIDTAALDARLIVCAACDLTHEQFIARPERMVSADEALRIAGWEARRLAGEPVSRLLGRREFWGLPFAIGPDTLDPRPDSETLVRAALELCNEEQGNKAPRVLDLGTGTGCLLIALLHELPEASGVGIDSAVGAVRVACTNARHLAVSERVAFCCGFWGEAVSAPFDMVVCNPPYIPSGEIDRLDVGVAGHDPRTALDGGRDGLDCFRRIAPSLSRLLIPGGWAVFEVGAGQADEVLSVLARHDLGRRQHDRCTWRDLAGHTRCVAVRCGEGAKM